MQRWIDRKTSRDFKALVNWLINLSRRNRNRNGIGIGFLVTNTCSKSINSECGIHSTLLLQLQLLLRLPPPPPTLFLPLLPALIDAPNGHAHWHLSYSTGPCSHGTVQESPTWVGQGRPQGRSRCIRDGGGDAWRLLFSFSTMTFQFSYCRVSVLFPFLFTACLLPCACCVSI